MICAKCKKVTNEQHLIDYSFQVLCDQCFLEMEACRRCKFSHDREISEMQFEINKLKYEIESLKKKIPKVYPCELEGCE